MVIKKQVRHICVVGLGLIGGSLGLSLRNNQDKYYLSAISRNKNSLEKGKRIGAVDEFFTEPGEFLAGTDIVVICVPVNRIVEQVERILPWLKPGSIITDVGSSKGQVVKDVDKLIARSGKRIYFVGSHPLAGSEKAGLDAARGHLYQNAYVILTPGRTSGRAIAKVRSMWEDTGALAVKMKPEVHDRIVAAISHLPHLAASALVSTAGSYGGNISSFNALDFAASGFRDTTRVAGGHPGIWTEIFLSNRSAVLYFLSRMIRELERYKTYIENKDEKRLYRLLERARGFKQVPPGSSRKDILPVSYEVYLDVEDRVGVIASVARILSKAKINIKDIQVQKSRPNIAGALRVGFEDEEARDRAILVLTSHGYRVSR